jgi:hypothetical protein
LDTNFQVNHTTTNNNQSPLQSDSSIMLLNLRKKNLSGFNSFSSSRNPYKEALSSSPPIIIWYEESG